MSDALKAFNRYINETYTGQELMKKHSLDEEGIWKIRGEDPNADMHGSHYQPDLGTVEGKLRDVIMYAVALPSFWSWGGGGNFESLGKKLPRIDSKTVEVRNSLLEEEQRLIKKLETIRTQLKGYK